MPCALPNSRKSVIFLMDFVFVSAWDANPGLDSRYCTRDPRRILTIDPKKEHFSVRHKLTVGGPLPET